LFRKTAVLIAAVFIIEPLRKIIGGASINAHIVK
jgi:hypothetical protein